MVKMKNVEIWLKRKTNISSCLSLKHIQNVIAMYFNVLVKANYFNDGNLTLPKSKLYYNEVTQIEG